MGDSNTLTPPSTLEACSPSGTERSLPLLVPKVGTETKLVRHRLPSLDYFLAQAHHASP